MAEFEIPLQGQYAYDPISLMHPDGATHLPMDGDYVPLVIFNRSFQKVMPTLQAVGNGAVQLSIGRPFGFMFPTIKTQLTEHLVFRRPGGPSANEWLLGVDVPQDLTVLDRQIFEQGAVKYIGYVRSRLPNLSP